MKNKRKVVNSAHVRQLQRIQTGEIQPTEIRHLPPGGTIIYFDSFYIKDKADSLLDLCTKLNTEIPVFYNTRNEVVQQPRKSLWFGPIPYKYSKFLLTNHSFSEYAWLDRVRGDLEDTFGLSLNSCLVNEYRDGSDKVGWHADNERLFGNDPSVVSVSFGVTRRFEVRRDTYGHKRPEHYFDLQHGSVIVMLGDMQKHWQHRVPENSTVNGTRYNLTFRCVI